MLEAKDVCVQSSYCKWYYPVLMPSSNVIFAAEILQGGCIVLINKMANVGDSLYFHILILKDVKCKHHQPVKNPFHFLLTLTLSNYFLRVACSFSTAEEEEWGAPELGLSESKCCCCILSVQRLSIEKTLRSVSELLSLLPICDIYFLLLWFLSLPTLSRDDWWEIIAPLFL